MSPDYVAYLTVTQIGKSVAGSALPNAPVVDDSLDRRPIGQRLSALRARVAEAISPSEAPTPAPIHDPAPAGC